DLIEASVLFRRGAWQDALQALQERVLPVFDRLGDVRSRAINMGQIADILEQRGETDEALRIRIEECLPAAQKIKDLNTMASIQFRCAKLRFARGGMEKGEIQTILDELLESFTMNQKLQRTKEIAYVGMLLGPVLAATGRIAEALTVLDQSANAFEHLNQAEQVAQVRELRKKIEESSRIIKK
ncbi:MAG: hypothetical protein V1899_02005, partial [Planctomycetota bacterium]